MTQTQDIAWVAGLLEGEGCFSNRANQKNGTNNQIRIALEMTDEDVIRRAAKILHGNVMGPYVRKSTHGSGFDKPMYRADWAGSRAAGIMMTVYSFMGNRRQERIKEILNLWKADKRKPLLPRP